MPAFAGRHLTSQMHRHAMSKDAKTRAFEKLMKDTGTYSFVTITDFCIGLY